MIVKINSQRENQQQKIAASIHLCICVIKAIANENISAGMRGHGSPCLPPPVTHVHGEVGGRL